MERSWHINGEAEVSEDLFHRRITARSVGLAYAFFRTRCLHVSLMSTTVPWNAIMRHAQTSGWLFDAVTIFEVGWNIATRTLWADVRDDVTKEQQKCLLLIPEMLRRLNWFNRQLKDVDIFYYRSFAEIYLKRNELFRDDVGHVVFVTPAVEPKKAGDGCRSLRLLTCGSVAVAGCT